MLLIEFECVVCVMVKGFDGFEIFIIDDLFDWVIGWKDLSDEEKV